MRGSFPASCWLHFYCKYDSDNMYLHMLQLVRGVTRELPELPRVPMSTRFCSPRIWAEYFTPVSSIEGCSQLRSAAADLLFVPRTRTVTIGPWAFVVSSPAAWNSLPVDLRDPGISLPSFRKKLKTYLFNTVTWLAGFIIFCNFDFVIC